MTATPASPACAPTRARLAFVFTMSGGDTAVADAPIRVLVADDNKQFLEALGALLEQHETFRVIAEATDGLAAIELADTLEPDAIVLDLHMPLLDGVTATARLRRDHPNVCLIALTADPDRSLHDSVKEAGADAVLSKDVLVDGLVDQLRAGHVTVDPAA